MNLKTNELRIAVISPFVDRRHGTERVLAEQLQRLANFAGVQIHLYSQRVDGLVVAKSGGKSEAGSRGIIWHQVPSVPGPHLLQYFWWFVANSLDRAADRIWGKLSADVIFSPGINALNADVIAVHIVFHAFYAQAIEQLRLRNAPVRSWARRLHRRIYYRCIMALENRIYRDPHVRLLPVSQLVAKQIRECFGRTDVHVIPNGVAVGEFHPAARGSRRCEARREFHLLPENFVLLLIGNDWVKKGLRCLLRAVALCADPNLRLLVVGKDDPALFARDIVNPFMKNAVRFLPPRNDVLVYYAAADVYTGPSLEDAFGMPILEAMACGLPVIASSFAGASEAIHDGANGMILREPESAEELAAKIGILARDEPLRNRLSAAAAETAQNYSWEKNATLLRDVLMRAAQKKQGEDS
jgi:glycosyltransferase involved in cell wall biosynthesis